MWTGSLRSPRLIAGGFADDGGAGSGRGLGTDDIDAALEIGAVVDADAGGLDVADETALLADGDLLGDLDVAFDGPKIATSLALMFAFTLPLGPMVIELRDSSSPSTSPSTTSSSRVWISPFISIEAPITAVERVEAVAGGGVVTIARGTTSACGLIGAVLFPFIPHYEACPFQYSG